MGRHPYCHSSQCVGCRPSSILFLGSALILKTMNFLLKALAISALSQIQFYCLSSALSLHHLPSPLLSRSSSSTCITKNNVHHQRQNWALYAKDQQRLSSSDGVDLLDTTSDDQQRHDIKIDSTSQINESSTQIHENETTNSLLQKLFLGIEPTPDILAIMAIYFVEGALGLARLAQTFLLKDELHLGPAELSAISGLLILPWTVKPLYGFLSDGLPLFGYRRRSYLILAGIVGFSSYAFLAYGFNGGGDAGVSKDMVLRATIALFMLSSASIAFSDVVADGIVVQKTREANEQGDNPALAGGRSSCHATLTNVVIFSNASFLDRTTIIVLGKCSHWRVTICIFLGEFVRNNEPQTSVWYCEFTTVAGGTDEFVN